MILQQIIDLIGKLWPSYRVLVACGKRGKYCAHIINSAATKLTALCTLYLGSPATSTLSCLPILLLASHLPCPHTSCSVGLNLHPTQFTWGFSLTLKSTDTLPVWSCQISASPSYLTQSLSLPTCQYLCVSLTSFSISQKIADSVRETESGG